MEKKQVFVDLVGINERGINTFMTKGTRQKLLSGFFPLRGGVPPISAKVFWAGSFFVKGGGGHPPIPLRKIPLKSSFFLVQKLDFADFHTFLALLVYYMVSLVHF